MDDSNDLFSDFGSSAPRPESTDNDKASKEVSNAPVSSEAVSSAPPATPAASPAAAKPVVAAKAPAAKKPSPKPDGEGEYGANAIEVLEGLEPVRLRPGMYIGGTDVDALHHLFAECQQSLKSVRCSASC